MTDSLVPGGNNDEFPTRERVFISEWMNDPAIPGVSLADARVEAGVTTELHRLSVKEYYVIRQGTGLMEVGDEEPFEVTDGDTLVIPAGVAQRITNTGRRDLLMQCVCMPRFTPGSYEPLEEDSG